jgi:hypothetical protein
LRREYRKIKVNSNRYFLKKESDKALFFVCGIDHPFLVEYYRKKRGDFILFTWHHGFWLYFFTRHHPRVWHYVIGSMLPDYIYVIAIAMMLLRGQLSWVDLVNLNPKMMMSLLPLYPWVVKIDLIGHSIVIWSIAFLATLFPITKGFRAFVIGWGTHLLIDSLTHADYANYFLYPISLFSVHSPISYWEHQFFGFEFKWVNGICVTMAILFLIYEQWRKK